MSQYLARIKTDADVALDKEHARLGNLYTPEAYQMYTELGFKNFLSKFSGSATKQAVSAAREVPFTFRVVDTKSEAVKVFEEARKALENTGALSVLPIYDIPHLEMASDLLGLSLSYEETNVWIRVTGSGDDLPLGQLTLDFGMGESGDALEEAAKETDAEVISTSYLKEELEKIRHLVLGLPKAQVATFDLKNQYPFWNIREEEFAEGIRLNGMFDLLIGAYLVNPLKNDYTPEDVASEYLSETIVGRAQLLGKLSFAQKLAEDAKAVEEYACHVSSALLRASTQVYETLVEMEMWELYEKMELPLSYVLYDMQRIGIHVVPEKLAAYGDQLTGRIEELDKAIHEEAGDPDFNIASPKQLGELLFEKMQIPGGKKTKTGYSTAADVLEKLAPDYPFVGEILEYRALTKLKSTYAEGLKAFIAGDSKIHTAFNQTVTATGRLSSSDPNLQNIPMRTDLGRAIRKVFIPSKEGWSFTDADYSQIELRILASFSGDESLIEAFRENRDIHRTTASKVFHVPFEEVTSQQRRDAKAVNFGIVYGISSFGLSQNLSISRGQAQEYINEYFEMFPGIKSYLDGLVTAAKEKGYSTTLMGRRRPIPELKNSNFMQRQFGERVAMNAPIQGAGADIMKNAMIRVWEGLHKAGLLSRLILQIHDELLIETAPGEEAEVERIMTEGMVGAANLAVQLDIDCHNGTDWFEAK